MAGLGNCLEVDVDGPEMIDPEVREALRRCQIRAEENRRTSKAVIDEYLQEIDERLAFVERYRPYVPAPVVPRPPPRPPPPPPPPPPREPETPEPEYDPDEEQREYAKWLAVLQKEFNCVGIHSWSFCRATRPSTGACWKVLALIPSVVLILLQCFLLTAIGLHALHPSCNRNEDCNAGMWCAPSSTFDGHSLSPGTCDDCQWVALLANQAYDQLPSWYNSHSYAVAEASIGEAVSHCRSVRVDAYPDRCDYLVRFHDRLTVGPLITLVISALTVAAALVTDMDKQAQNQDVFDFRVAKFPGNQNNFVIFVGWAIFNFRKFVLPSFVAMTFTFLAIAVPVTPGRSLSVHFVLCALVVFLVYNMDTLFGMCLLLEDAQNQVREAYAVLEAMDSDMRERPNTAWLHKANDRFMALCWGCFMTLTTVFTESLLRGGVFRADLHGIVTDWTEVTSQESCTSVLPVLALVALLLVVVLAFVQGINYQVTRRCSDLLTGPLDVVCTPIFSAFFIPAISILFLWVQNVPIPDVQMPSE